MFQSTGYVPVYIRYGETPLDEINPNLAAAFHEYGISARKIKSGLDDVRILESSYFNAIPSE